ncbi:MAG TPA: hypothetical protein ENI87_12565 [bacterium]|nr:hypothetical protein [bacterium]
MVPQGPAPGNRALQHSFTVANGAAATASPLIADALAELLHVEVDEWPQHGLEPIKRRTVRSVFRGRLGGIDVHVKVFRADTLADRARDAVRTGKGRREAENLLRARALDLPAVEPLAFGTALSGAHHCSLLVTRSLAAEPFTFPADDGIAARTGALLRRLHDLGVEPTDLHPGNVLVTAAGEPILCDLTSLRHAGELTLRRRAAGLAFFCNPIDGGPLDPLTRSFRRGYEQPGRALPEAFLAELARASRRLRAAALRSFGRRSERPCRHTEVEPRRRATPRWFLHRGDGGVDDELQAACRAFDASANEPRRSGRRGGIWLTDAFAVKRRDPGKARKLWRAHYWLSFARVPAATPLALCLDRGQGLVFTRVAGPRDLATEIATGALDAAAIARTATALGHAIGRLHGHGLRNRDLKFDNLVRDADSGEVRIVDLDGVTLHAADDTRGTGRDLGRLLAAFRTAGEPGGSASLRRFVRAYYRARRRLLQRPPMQRILRRAEQRAGEWAAAHNR